MALTFNIYIHIKPNGEIFYVGKGRDGSGRAYRKKHRSIFWMNITKKYPDYEIFIIDDGITEEDAFKLERRYIKILGRRDLGTGTLVNMTDGGEGSSGIIWSDDTLKKRGESIKKWYSDVDNKKKWLSNIRNFHDNNTYSGVLVLDTQTGIYYETIKEAAESNMKSLRSICRYLNGEIKNKTNLIKC